ncbi:hypothetical protein HMPREF0766_12373 [Sphingobacterium spiritivorum ATCC 33861]|uniref:Uncharacterized protein n=1 Tax=Sphingobacterium spiritivorum ATCC 33861 TaxID=525373 RepID=D7VN03_SPHSI|nr:hypothetical protein HMPREF0766_12373 [Sphingobacterium spiritivorum ATCC 33861]
MTIIGKTFITFAAACVYGNLFLSLLEDKIIRILVPCINIYFGF